MPQLAHRTAIERLTAVGAVPNTLLTLVTELSYDWKSALADPAREIIKWYQSEVGKLAAAKRVIEIAEQVPALSRAPVGADADAMLCAAREKSDAELDALRLYIAGFSAVPD